MSTAQKMKFSVKDFSGKCDQIPWKLWIWSHLLEKSYGELLFLCSGLCFSKISHLLSAD